jgi:excisionase family DNA binding protein
MGLPSIDKLWRVADVARYLRASISWVYKAAERGDLPCVRFGALLRFHPEAIKRIARAGLEQPRPPSRKELPSHG